MLFDNLDWDKETDSKKMCLKKEQLTNTQQQTYEKQTQPHIPKFIIQLLTYVRSLEFTESPDYNKIFWMIANSDNIQ